MAVSSSVDICNIALNMIGESLVTSITGSEDKQVILNLLYYPVLDQALRKHSWSFAMHRQALSSDAGDNLTIYDYKYQLPVDPYCVKPVCLLDSNNQEVDRETYPFLEEERYLYTDVASAKLKYVKRITDATQFDSTFVLYFAAYLAKEIAFRLTDDMVMANRMEQKAELFYREARWHDTEESYVEESPAYWEEAKDQ